MKKYLLLLLLAVLAACGGRDATADDSFGDVGEASLLKISDKGKYTVVEVANPWKTGELLDRYVLVPRGEKVDSLPAGTVLEVPLRSAVVYSSVHTTGIEMLGASEAVSGVADAQYFSRLPNANVVDIGPSLSPSIEKVITLAPDAILLSPYQNSGFGEITRTGVPIVQMADYMENTPLGRAQWLKFLGLLFGKEESADSIFSAVSERYNQLKANVAASNEPKPKVITEQLTSGTWYVPGGQSYMAHILQDAGASYAWTDDPSTGSLQLNIEAVLAAASDADFWLVRTYGYDETRTNMLTASDLYRHFKAFNSDGIYGCNTAQTNIFDIMAFRPDSVLEEYVSIFHPSISGRQPRFFQKIK